MSDKRFGTIHGHAHVRVPQRYATRYNPEIGANLRFRDVSLEASRKRGMRSRKRQEAER
jgi:hypothetical protein